jgi:hypothetical protein
MAKGLVASCLIKHRNGFAVPFHTAWASISVLVYEGGCESEIFLHAVR